MDKELLQLILLLLLSWIWRQTTICDDMLTTHQSMLQMLTAPVSMMGTAPFDSEQPYIVPEAYAA